MKPYYQDDSVALYKGRCEDVLPGLSLSGSVHLITDPPYFKVKDSGWDNQWAKTADFLQWMGEWLDLSKPLLSPDASIWVFASPELTSAVESIVASRFRVLNSVRWVKPQGWHMKAELSAARSFLSPWEGIIFAEQDVEHSPFGQYMRAEWERAGWKPGPLGRAMGFDSKMPARWLEGNSLPTSDAYEKMRTLLGKGFLLRDYQDLRNQFFEGRRTFNVRQRDRSSDVVTFDTVAPYPGKHVCEKPIALLKHIIETTTRPGDTIIDCFAGSGAVLDAARQLGRKAVGIEMDAYWCQQIEKRLSQQTFDFGDIA